MSIFVALIILAIVAAISVLLFRHLKNNGGGEACQVSKPDAATAANGLASTPAAVPKAPTLRQAQAYDQQARQAAASCEQAIKVAQRTASANISFRFMQRQEELARESRRLEGKLQQHMAQRLETSSFHYYTQLHFDSMLAADQRHQMYKEACGALDEVGRVIVAIGKGTIRVSKQEKDELYKLKDGIKASRDAHLANTRLLNNQTHAFKEKIRSECGERGREWADARERNAKR